MASTNLEFVRSVFVAWERGEYGSVEWAHSDIEYVVVGGPSPGSVTAGEVAESWRSYLDAWEDFRIGADGYREIDDERVLVLTRFSGRGKTSGLEIAQTWGKGANLFHVRDGKVRKHIFYFDRDRALADLGLAREGGTGD
jgi:ketosteroid isomerase-like protein